MRNRVIWGKFGALDLKKRPIGKKGQPRLSVLAVAPAASSVFSAKFAYLTNSTPHSRSKEIAPEKNRKSETRSENCKPPLTG